MFPSLVRVFNAPGGIRSLKSEPIIVLVTFWTLRTLQDSALSIVIDCCALERSSYFYRIQGPSTFGANIDWTPHLNLNNSHPHSRWLFTPAKFCDEVRTIRSNTLMSPSILRGSS